MSNVLYFPAKDKAAVPPAPTLDQRIVLVSRRPGNPAKKLDMATLALVRLHGGCHELAESVLDLGNQKALAISVIAVIREYVEGAEKL
jgi:hypothetical protein